MQALTSLGALAGIARLGLTAFITTITAVAVSATLASPILGLSITLFFGFAIFLTVSKKIVLRRLLLLLSVVRKLGAAAEVLTKITPNSIAEICSRRTLRRSKSGKMLRSVDRNSKTIWSPSGESRFPRKHSPP